MSVTYEFRYIPPDGQELVTLEEWVETLTADEQTEFNQAVLRITTNGKQKIEEGDIIASLKVNEGIRQVVWKNEETANVTVNATPDPVWLSYFDRYIAETGVQFEKVKITE